MDYSNITTKQFIEIKKIISNDYLNKLDKDCRIIALLKNKTLTEVNEWKFWKLNWYRRQIQFLYSNDLPKFHLRRWLFINGTIYKALTKPTQYSVNRYLSMKACVEYGGIDKNLNKIVSLFYKPLFKSDKLDERGNYVDLDTNQSLKIERDFEKVKVSKVLGMVFFYSDVSSDLKIITDTYLKETEEAMEEMTKQAKALNLY
jgi:hypothetical protein